MCYRPDTRSKPPLTWPLRWIGRTRLSNKVIFLGTFFQKITTYTKSRYTLVCVTRTETKQRGGSDIAPSSHSANEHPPHYIRHDHPRHYTSLVSAIFCGLDLTFASYGTYCMRTLESHTRCLRLLAPLFEGSQHHAGETSVGMLAIHPSPWIKVISVTYITMPWYNERWASNTTPVGRSSGFDVHSLSRPGASISRHTPRLVWSYQYG